MRMQSVNLIGSGEKSGDPQAARRAIDDMTESALGNTDASERLTTAFNDLINKAGGASTYLGQIATAAKQEAEQRLVWQQRNKGGGWEGEFGANWARTQQEIFNPRTDVDNVGPAKQDLQALKDDLRGRVEQIWLASKNFNIQQARAQEEFDIQRRRAIEQASASWQNPYTRGANQQQLVNSAGLIQFNLGEQQETLTGQLGAIRSLTKRGLSKDARAMLDLTNPNMGNQAIVLGKTMTEDQIKAYNDLAAERKKAVGDLTKEFSTPFQNAEEDFKRATNNAVDDMKRMGEQSHKTLKALLEDTTKLAEAGGYGSMAALAAAWDAYNQSKEGTKAAKEERIRIGSEDWRTAVVENQLAGKAAKNKENWDYQATNSYDKEGLPYYQTGVPTTWQVAVEGVTLGPDGKPLPADWSEWGPNHKKSYWNEHTPKMAAGGIATYPTTGMIGDAGPEAVIPLNARGINFMMDVVKGFRTSGFNSPTEYKGVSNHTVYNQNTILSGPMTFVDPDPVKTAKRLSRMNATKNLLRGEAATS
jgi:hypothetical protein